MPAGSSRVFALQRMPDPWMQRFTRKYSATRSGRMCCRVWPGRRSHCPAAGSTIARGCELFEQITTLPEYYPTRTETAILRGACAEIAEFCGPTPTCSNTAPAPASRREIVVGALERPRSYVPIDIAGGFLDQTAERFRRRFAGLRVNPVVADFTADFSLPPRVLDEGRRVAFFPGSTLGNLNPKEAGLFLQRMRRHVGPQGAAIIGVDLQKDLEVLLAAYDDAAGVTARVQPQHPGAHQPRARGPVRRRSSSAMWRAGMSWRRPWKCTWRARSTRWSAIGGKGFGFRRGETIHTESSRKYEIKGFSEFARRHGWHTLRLWTDPRRQFAVFGLI